MPLKHIATSSEEDFIANAVNLLAEKILASLADHDSCRLGLSGGSTPAKIYEALGKEAIDWAKVKLFLVDERFIHSHNPETNQNLIRDTLLKTADVPEENLIFPDTDLPEEECVAKYAADLQEHIITDHLPEVLTLGMGEDGHIASLFPPVEDIAMSDEALVVHTTTRKFKVFDRISVSLNLIAAAGSQIFLLKGEGKKKVWEEMMASDEDEHRWPAKRVLEGGEDVILISWW